VDNELDRIELGDRASFSAWFYAWRRRWLLGEPIRVLLARDLSHAIVVSDPTSRPPKRLPSGVVEEFQLSLLDE